MIGLLLYHLSTTDNLPTTIYQYLVDKIPFINLPIYQNRCCETTIDQPPIHHSPCFRGDAAAAPVPAQPAPPVVRERHQGPQRAASAAAAGCATSAPPFRTKRGLELMGCLT